MYVYVCMHTCKNVSIYVGIYTCIYLCEYVHVCLHVCISRVDKQRCITASFIEKVRLWYQNLQNFMLFLTGKSAYNERQPLWSKTCLNNAFWGKSKFPLAKVRIIWIKRKVRIFLATAHGVVLDFIRTWYGRSAHLYMWTFAWMRKCSLQLHAFNGKGVYLATFPLSLFVIKFVENS